MASLVAARPCPVAPRQGAASVKRGSVVLARVTYKVTLKTPKEGDVVLDVDENTYILDAADDAGVDLPYSCRAGGCSICCARVVSGAPVDQSDQNFLADDQMAKGFAMLCVSYPTGDVVIETHADGQL